MDQQLFPAHDGMADLLGVDEVRGMPLAAVDALAQARVVADVMGQALADDQAAQGGGSGVMHAVRSPAGAVTDEVSWADRVARVADLDLALALEHVGALILVAMDVELRGFAAGRDLDEMNAQAGQAGGITQRFVVPARIVVQEVDLVGPGHGRNVCGGEQIAIHASNLVGRSRMAGVYGLVERRRNRPCYSGGH